MTETPQEAPSFDTGFDQAAVLAQRFSEVADGFDVRVVAMAAALLIKRLNPDPESKTTTLAKIILDRPWHQLRPGT